MNTLASRAVEAGKLFERAKAELSFYETVGYINSEFGEARAMQYIDTIEGELLERSINIQ